VAADAPKAFFSYSRDDLEFALRLATDLKKAGANVWMDKLDIRPGQLWERKAEEALDNCARLLVILSPASVSSRNVMAEVGFALDEQKEVIPVLYRECKVPFRLRPLQYVDFRSDYSQGLEELLRALGANQSQPRIPVPTVLPEAGRGRDVGELRAQSRQKQEPEGSEQAPLEDERGQGAERLQQNRKKLTVWELRGFHTLTGHSGLVRAVALTPDGQRAVSGGRDQMLKLWDLASGHEIRTLAGHRGTVRAVAVTLDGQRAVSASADNTLKVWDLTSGHELRTLTGHASYVNSVALTPDGQCAVSASGDNTLKVWELASGCELRTLTGHTDAVSAVAVTADGQRAVSASADNTLKVWDLGIGRELRTFAGHADTVVAVAVTTDGQRVVSASADQTLKVWELASGYELRTLQGHSDRVLAVAVSGDGRLVVSASSDSTLKVWDVESGHELATFRVAPLLCCAVSSNEKTFVAGGSDGVIYYLPLE
jgi:acetolactate synthase regulatory subunit